MVTQMEMNIKMNREELEVAITSGTLEALTKAIGGSADTKPATTVPAGITETKEAPPVDDKKAKAEADKKAKAEKAKADAEAKAAKEAEEAAKEEPVTAITMEQLRAKALEIKDAAGLGMTVVKGILEALKVPKVTELKTEQFEEAMAKFQAALDENI